MMSFFVALKWPLYWVPGEHHAYHQHVLTEKILLELFSNFPYISVKIFCQDFLLKTTNLMTYAARDKNSLLNFLDENLVNMMREPEFEMWEYGENIMSYHEKFSLRTWTKKMIAFLLDGSCYSFHCLIKKKI